MKSRKTKQLLNFLTIFSILCSGLPVLAQTNRGAGVRVTNNATSTEKRLALVIGNGSYQKADPLVNPVNDATDVAAALRELGFEVIFDTDADKRTMERLMRQFGEKLSASKGVGLFYYAGHGLQVNGENYLLPVDADIPAEDEVKYAAVPIGFVMDKMESAKNSLNLIILDACRNNPFARSWRGFRDVGDNKGLAKITPPTGTLVLYATQPGNVASDGAGRNGLFTSALLKQMRQPNVEYDQMVRLLAREVSEKSKGKQLPWKEGISLNDFYFAGNADSPPKPFDKNAGEAAFWSSIENSADPQDFESFLKEYPKGVYAATANFKLGKLRKKTAAADSSALTSESTKTPANTGENDNPGKSDVPSRAVSKLAVFDSTKIGGGDKSSVSSYVSGLKLNDVFLLDAKAWSAADLLLALDEKADVTNVLKNSYNSRTSPIINTPSPKVGVVNTMAFDDTKAGIVRYTSAMNTLEAEFKPVNSELQTMVTKYQNLAEEIKSLQNQYGASASRVQPKIDEYQKLEREIKLKQEDAKARFEVRRKALIGPVMADVGKVLTDFARQKGYTLILDIAKMADADLVLSLDAKADLTKDFIAVFNAHQTGGTSVSTNDGNSSSAPNIAPSKIGFMNTAAFDDTQSGIAKYTSAMNTLEAEFKPLNNELQAMLTRYKNLGEEIKGLQSQYGVSSSKVQSKIDEYQKLERDLKFKQEDAKARFDVRQKALLGPVLQDIGRAIQEFSTQKGYTLILDIAKMTSADLIFSVDSKADVTRDFILFYNAR